MKCAEPGCDREAIRPSIYCYLHGQGTGMVRKRTWKKWSGKKVGKRAAKKAAKKK